LQQITGNMSRLLAVSVLALCFSLVAAEILFEEKFNDGEDPHVLLRGREASGGGLRKRLPSSSTPSPSQ
jgi:hypothetical protein